MRGAHCFDLSSLAQGLLMIEALEMLDPESVKHQELGPVFWLFWRGYHMQLLDSLVVECQSLKSQR